MTSARSQTRRRRGDRRKTEAWAAGPPPGMVDVWMDAGAGLLHDGLPDTAHRCRPVYDDGEPHGRWEPCDDCDGNEDPQGSGPALGWRQVRVPAYAVDEVPGPRGVRVPLPAGSYRVGDPAEMLDRETWCAVQAALADGAGPEPGERVGVPGLVAVVAAPDGPGPYAAEDDEGGRGRVSTRSGLLAVVAPSDFAARGDWLRVGGAAVVAPDAGLVADDPDGLVVAGVRLYAPYGGRS